VREIRNEFGLEYASSTSLSEIIHEARRRFLTVALSVFKKIHGKHGLDANVFTFLVLLASALDNSAVLFHLLKRVDR